MTNSADEAWLDTIGKVKLLGQPVEPQLSTGARGRVSFEVINSTMSFDMRFPVVTCKPNTSWVYMAAEPIWVIGGSGNLHYLPEVERIQTPYSDNGVTVYGAYGPRFRLQKENVIERLNYDRNTRQAVMVIWRRNPPPLDSEPKDIPCTVAMQWLIRDDQIHAIVNMRSSDVGLGLPYDMLTFTCMTAEVASMLNDPVELGTCYVNAGSCHIYEDQWDKLNVDDLTPRVCPYTDWSMWKWPAIKQKLEKIAKVDVTQFSKRDVQAEAFRCMMEISGGKTRA